MKRYASFAIVPLLIAACEPSEIAAPSTAPLARPQPSLQHGDGTSESPFYWVEPAEWVTTYGFDETAPLYEGEAAPCPPVYRQTLWLNIDIANVGVRKFWFQGPMHWTRTIAPGFAIYDLTVPGVDERGEWTASGPVVAECRRGLLPGLGMIRLTDHLGQLRRNGIRADDGGGCGADAGDGYQYITSYESSPGDEDGHLGIRCGGGNTGGSSFNPADFSCSWDYVTFVISRDGGKTWETWWAGWAQVCSEA